MADDRPWVLQRSHRRWWKRSSVWIMILAFLTLALLALGLLVSLRDRGESEDDSDDSSIRRSSPARACLRGFAG